MLMSRQLLACLLSFLFVGEILAQPTLFGANNYTEYQIGTLPFVISVPHGGSLNPATIPDRTCNNPVFATDALTIETALEIKNRLFSRTGCFPHLVIAHLQRAKLDPNRNLNDGACGQPEAVNAWNEFHNFIKDARNAANAQYDSNTLFIDLHGHGNPIQRIELGYLLYDDELELSDSLLNSNTYLNYSSIRRLALQNVHGYSHASLLRGPKSFGALLADSGYPTVPSPAIPFPGLNTNYFSGGYITANHTCYAPDAPINGFQMELNFDNIRDTAPNRASFAQAFADALIAYMNEHFAIQWNTCTPAIVAHPAATPTLQLSPNPALRGDALTLHIPASMPKATYQVVNMWGVAVARGSVEKPKTEIITKGMLAGVYMIRLFDDHQGALGSWRLLILE